MEQYGFNEVVTDLLIAYRNTSKNKNAKYRKLFFDLRFEEEIIDLATGIINRTYEVRPSTCFVVTSPVIREIIAADFKDRIIHHYIYEFLNPFLEKYLIADCYSCREGKGTLFGINRMEHHIRSASNNYQKPTYVLQLDLKGYFMHINRDILYRKTMALLDKIKQRKEAKEIPEEKLKIQEYLISKVIYNDPLKNAIFKGDPKLITKIPLSKTLKNSPPNCGLPIGNLTSQLFSNLYLNDFDNYMKRQLKIKHYGRYVDDFFIIDTDKKKLLALMKPIKEYLKNEVALEIHPHKISLTEVKKGITFLGIHLKPHRRYLKTKTLKRLLNNMKVLTPLYGACLDDKYVRNRVLSVTNSYLGILNATKSFNFKKKYLIKEALALKIGYGNNFFKKVILFPKYKKHKINPSQIL